MRARSSTYRSSAATAITAPGRGPGASPDDGPREGPVWILTAQIKNIGPNIPLWAPRAPEKDEPPFRRQESVLGESRLGPAPMVIVENPRIVEASLLPGLPEFRFIRRLTPEDEPRLSSLASRETALLSFVRERAAYRHLPMIFVESVANFAANDFLLYYTAEGRVDFRELLKDIHAKYRGRVELRQISPREYTALLDGVGSCGKSLCCSSFLKSFRTISTRMAREVDAEPASLRSTGMCGRLKCCLSFDLQESGEGESTLSGEEGSSSGGRPSCRKSCGTRGDASSQEPVPGPGWKSVSLDREQGASSALSSVPPSPSRRGPASPDNRHRKDSSPRV